MQISDETWFSNGFISLGFQRNQMKNETSFSMRSVFPSTSQWTFSFFLSRSYCSIRPIEGLLKALFVRLRNQQQLFTADVAKICNGSGCQVVPILWNTEHWTIIQMKCSKSWNCIKSALSSAFIVCYKENRRLHLIPDLMWTSLPNKHIQQIRASNTRSCPTNCKWKLKINRTSFASDGFKREYTKIHTEMEFVLHSSFRRAT